VNFAHAICQKFFRFGNAAGRKAVCRNAEGIPLPHRRSVVDVAGEEALAHEFAPNENLGINELVYITVAVEQETHVP
jgi:hypothetical protein